METEKGQVEVERGTLLFEARLGEGLRFQLFEAGVQAIFFVGADSVALQFLRWEDASRVLDFRRGTPFEEFRGPAARKASGLLIEAKDGRFALLEPETRGIESARQVLQTIVRFHPNVEVEAAKVAALEPASGPGRIRGLRPSYFVVNLPKSPADGAPVAEESSKSTLARKRSWLVGAFLNSGLAWLGIMAGWILLEFASAIPAPLVRFGTPAFVLVGGAFATRAVVFYVRSFSVRPQKLYREALWLPPEWGSHGPYVIPIASIRAAAPPGGRRGPPQALVSTLPWLEPVGVDLDLLRRCGIEVSAPADV